MPDLPQLDARDQRILGALMEKQVTVPATYPMTLNALRTACNQSNSRDPVTDYDEAAVEEGVRVLKDRGLLRVVWADRGPRTLKYHQLLTEEIDVDEREAAVLTVLLLRGPNAAGELRSRTERLHPFADRAEVEELLHAMARRGLVREQPRQPGQRDQRWTHLLGAGDEAAAPEPEPSSVDPLAEGAERRDEKVRRTYGTVAPEYADAHRSILDSLPFERWLLDRVADEASGSPVADAGSGTGAVSGYLQGRGALVRGFDLTPSMVEQARALVPGVPFEVADLRRLLRPVDADGWGAITAWYSLIHLAPAELPDAVGALARVLRPGGLLAVAAHTGGGVRTLTEWFGHDDLDLDFVLHDRQAMVRAFEAAGLEDVEWYHRGPTGEETTERLYVLGRRP